MDQKGREAKLTNHISGIRLARGETSVLHLKEINREAAGGTSHMQWEKISKKLKTTLSGAHSVFGNTIYKKNM